MKRIAASVSLIALGASCIYSNAEESFMTGDAGKIWNVSARLRGFYDDNINTSETAAQHAFGFSIEPQVGIHWQRDQNTLIASYMYSYTYYDHTVGPYGRYDQNHFFNLEFDHTFSERYSIKVRDDFSVGQEPDVVRSRDFITTVQRIPGDNFRNDGGFTFNAELTPVFGLEAGYQNLLFDYHDPNESIISDRIEQYAHLDARWHVLPETVAVLGYQFALIDYTRNGIIPATGLPSDSRNNWGHYIYAGADHTFNPDFSVSFRGGGRYTEYYNDPTSSHSEISPYAKIGLTWTYGPESYVTGGFTYDWNSTDVLNGSARGSQAGTVFATWRHRIIPNLFGSINGQYQHSTVISSSPFVDDGVEQIYLIGVNFEYQFCHYMSAEVGYDFTKVDSEFAARSYDRNKVYIGVRAIY